MTPATCTKTENSVLVALSGGVDSAVCAAKLKQDGRAVSGVYFVMSDAHLAGRAAAQKTADALGIELHIEDLRDVFKQQVTEPFCEVYCAGKTPNPCIRCNPDVKFHYLLQKANELGISHIASGHYARVEQRGEYFVLKRAKSAARDQSYMLCRLRQEQLSRLLLPLGELEKSEVRGTARELGLFNAEQPDSQEICFVPDNDYASFIHESNHAGASGHFIGPQNEDFGPHKGVELYTIGQRRGLGISYASPLYVGEIQQDGTIRLVENADLYKRKVSLVEIDINPAFSLNAAKIYTVKLRSAALPAICSVTSHSDDCLVLAFETPQRAPAPGQTAVLYSGDHLVGCGVIQTAQRD